MKIHLLCLLLATAIRSWALELASPFTAHMVLQRDEPVPVWGSGEPGEHIAVEFAGQKLTTTADDNGNWRVDLAALSASTADHRLTVTGSESDQPIELDDVVIGEVWLCVGGSLMDRSLGIRDPSISSSDEDDRSDATNLASMIRVFSAPTIRARDPQPRVPGEWKLCTEDVGRATSAVGVAFARRLSRRLGVPIGIVVLTERGSAVPAWVRRDAIRSDPQLKPILDSFDSKAEAYVPPSEDDMKRWVTAAEKPKRDKKRNHVRIRPDPTQDSHSPTVLYNGVVAPIVPYAVRGVLWDPDDAPTESGALIFTWDQKLISDWRTLWSKTLPFYFTQLPARPGDADGPIVRESETQLLGLPNTGMAVTTDLFDRTAPAAQGLRTLGERLARIALAKTYGQNLEYSGPQFESMKSFGGALRLNFSHATDSLADHGQPLGAFEVAGSDGRFYPAVATLEGRSVFVSSPDVPVPTVVRFGWAVTAGGGNLYNQAGLPAAPFRTDRPPPHW